MLTIVYGALGSGKTLLLAIISKYANRKIVSNFKLHVPYEEFSLQKFVNAEYENCIILLDEGYVYLESRLSMTKKNRASSYVLFQSRKKNVNLYITVQLISTIDIRYRTLTDAWILCEGLTKKGYKYTFMDGTTGIRRSTYLPLEKAKLFYSIYDTNEIIGIQEDYGEYMGKNEAQEFINKVVKEIRNAYPHTKITHNIVKKWYWEKGYTNSTENIVYVYLKEQEENGNIEIYSNKKSKKKKK